MKKVLITFSLLLVLSGIAAGQADPINNQYVLNPVSINPAFAGGRGALNLFTFYGKQWIGIDGSPSTIAISADAPFADQKIGLGLMIVSDKIGVTRENQFTTSYAYRMQTEKGILSFGLGAGITLTNTAFSDLIVLDPGDEIHLVDTRTFAVPNFSFGTHYSYNNYFVGFSIPRLLNYSFDLAKNKYILDNKTSSYSYLLNTGYIFDAGNNVKVFPSVLLRYNSIPSPLKFQLDVNTHLCLFDRFWLGASYRNKRNFATMFQFAPNEQLRIAYSYNFETSQLGKYSNGSHEVMLRYVFKYSIEAVNPLNF
ncbi:MAG TPA: type IX secretion system membrane protein PorP/SprF [Bacteroidetes bacterium]|nr:type IX secretion system membrane protein PorP/SprF [Bacteroidota bacterium]